MAIRRCPYCKAIIDEGSEFCSNCGTQLLFPEDEYIHEEVPGEKVVEEETAEEEDRKKKKSSRRRKKKEEEVEVEPMEEGAEEKAAEEEVEEIIEKPEKEDESQDVGSPPGEGRDEYFVEKQEPAFGTDDLEKVIDPEEKEKAEIEKFLKSLKEDRDEWDGEIPPTDELPPWAEKIKEEKPDEMPEAIGAEAEGESEPEEELPEIEEPQEDVHTEEEQTIEEEQIVETIKEVEEEVKEELSPIADEVLTEEKKEVLEPVGLTPEDEVPEVKIPEEEPEEEAAEEQRVEEEIAEEEVSEADEAKMPDTGMGLPEGVEQENLPFSDKSVGLFGQAEKSPPSRLSKWLKSRAFDVLFIGAFWIVALHIASRMLSTNIFKLISVSVLPTVGFYLALLGVYLFLFFLFLGQTLGDHLFPYEE